MTHGIPDPTWFVGCGNMAGAMVEGWRSAGVDLSRRGRDPPERHAGRGRPHGHHRWPKPAPPPKLAILGFKPQKLDEVAPELAPAARARKRSSCRSSPGSRRRRLRSRFLRARSIVRIDAQSAGGDPPRSDRAVQRRRRRCAARRSCRELFGQLGLCDVDDERGESGGDRLGRGRRAGLCRALRRRAGQGRAEARAVPELAATDRARDRARDRRGWPPRPASDGRDRAPRRQPQRHDRGRASRCSTATTCSSS